MATRYAILVTDPKTGGEHTVRLETDSHDEASRLLEAMREVLQRDGGDAKLIEVTPGTEPTPTEPRSQSAQQSDPPSGHFPPGSVPHVCPKCGESYWSGGHSWVRYLFAIILFPLGLLLLLIQPTWTCRACGFSYRSYTPPVGAGDRDIPWPAIVMLAVVGLMVLGWIVMVATRMVLNLWP